LLIATYGGTSGRKWAFLVDSQMPVMCLDGTDGTALWNFQPNAALTCAGDGKPQA
jgi:outer membrane protein assembly factor BamB